MDYDVVLINLPSTYLLNDAAYPPMGLMTVGGCMIDWGLNVKLIDFSGNSHPSIPDCDCYAMTCVTPNMYITKEFIHGMLPKNSHIILGGAHPTFMPQNTIDYMDMDNNLSIVIGEYEGIALQIWLDIFNNDFSLKYNGGIVSEDMMEAPYRQLVNLHKYKPGGEKATTVYTSRGCPYKCAFCSKLTNNTYRCFSELSIKHQIEYCKNKGFDKIVIGDDNFVINKPRAMQLLDVMKVSGCKFRLNQDARMLDEKFFKKSSESNVTDISFGIESGDQRMLNLMNKQSTVENGIKALSLTREYGMESKAYFLVNFPGETEKSMTNTLKFAEKTQPDKWMLNNFSPLPGSNTFTNPSKYGITWLSQKWDDYYLAGKGDLHPTFIANNLSIDQQIKNYNNMYTKLKDILG